MTTAIMIIGAYLVADFLSGFFHWLEDRYSTEDMIWPIGEYIAKPNLRHHDRPTFMLMGNYWHRNYTTIIPACTIAAVLWLCGAHWFWILSFVFLSQANEVHGLAHRMGKNPAWVEVLQEAGVFCSPRQHAHHHKSPHRIRYCVMTNLLNPILDAFLFWDALEWLLARFGMKVAR